MPIAIDWTWDEGTGAGPLGTGLVCALGTLITLL